MLNKLNTKVRFISMLRSSGNSQDVGAHVSNVTSEEAKTVGDNALFESNSKEAFAGVSDKSFLAEQHNSPQDMMGAFEMGFGDEDEDPDHRKYLHVDEDEQHFVKLRKFNQRGKNKNKNKKKGSPLHADINGTNGRMYSNSEGNAPNVKRESYVKAIQRVLRKDRDHHASSLHLQSHGGKESDAARELKRRNVIYHGIKLVDFRHLYPKLKTEATVHEYGASKSVTEEGVTKKAQDIAPSMLSHVVHVIPAAIATECQIVRSLGEWSGGLHENSIHTAYRRLIRNSERYIMIENQFFISGMNGDQRIKNRIIEEIFQRIVRAHMEQPHQFKVYIFIPLLPSAEGEIDRSPVIRACMYWQFQTLSRGKRSLYNMLREAGISPEDYVSVFGLRTWDLTPGTGVPVSELVYIHSKVMVVDDEWAIIGSANINDRSLVGNRDSEIAAVIHDTAQFVEIDMADGTKLNVGKFGYELRTRLLQEHCGIPASNIHHFDDLSSDATFNRINNIAESNTQIFKDIFGCVPNDDVHSVSELRQYRIKLAEMKALAERTPD